MRSAVILGVLAAASAPISAGPGTQDAPAPRPGAQEPRAPEGKDRYGDPLPSLARARLRHPGGVLSVCLTRDGKTIATGGVDIRLWEAATGKELRTVVVRDGGLLATSIAFTPDGGDVASGTIATPPLVRLWETATGKELLALKAEQGRVPFVAISPDGTMLASGGQDGTIRLWDVTTGKELRTLKGHAGDVASVAFSPDGKTLASGSSNDGVRLWETATGKELLKHEGHGGKVVSAAFTPDGKAIVSGSSDHGIRMWEAATGRELLKIGPLGGDGGELMCLAVSPDGKAIAAGSIDGRIGLWETATGQQVLALKDDAGSITCVAFAPDGRSLLSGSLGGTLLVWDAVPDGSPAELSAESLRTLWGELALADGARGWRASGALVRGGEKAVEFLRDRVASGALREEQARRIDSLIAQLDGDDIAARDAAGEELVGFGVEAVPKLREVLKGAASEEVRARVRAMIRGWDGPIPKPGAPLARSRAIRILEWIRSKAARAALEGIVRDSPVGREREEARAALLRAWEGDR